MNDRAALLNRATRLEWLTVGWNVIEGVIAVSAAIASGSVALLGFGLDSGVESARPDWFFSGGSGLNAVGGTSRPRESNR